MNEKNTYTSNVYLVLGTWNAIEDVNTLVDVGRDPSLIEKIREAPTGVGKKRVEQVVLTHSHYDHTSILPLVREVFKPTVYAFSPYLKGVDHILKNGDTLKLGDRMFEIIHVPEHSSDSICLYCEEYGVLFVGDTPVKIQTVGNTYGDRFVRTLEKLSRRDIRSIYFGHGDPLLNNCNTVIRTTYENVNKKHSVMSC